ncbi:MAG: SAM-dependent chlorinase/fluorinase [Bacteroidota bacterium]
MPALVTLLTDFGTRDGYVAAMKGVMLTQNAALRFVDITHDIAPQDVMEAAFVLRQAWPHFPAGTVHLTVVDPGVGTERHPVAARFGDQFVVGPDNGLFPLAFAPTMFGAEGEALARPDEAVALDASVWRTPTPSRTFHGRDIFAPAAALLASGAALADLGTPLDALRPLHWLQPQADAHGIQGWVLHLDHFGNALTNIPRAVVDAHADGRSVKGYVGSAILRGLQPTYGAVAEGEPLMLYGSDDLLEISVRGGSAASLFSLRKGLPVRLVFTDRIG